MDIHHRGTETRSETREPNVSAASAPSTPSGFAFDFCFPQRLRVSAVNISCDCRQDAEIREPKASVASAISVCSGFALLRYLPPCLRDSVVNILF